MNTFRVALIAALLSSASAYATAAIADTPATAPSSRVDAQAQAAALLSRPRWRCDGDVTAMLGGRR